MPLAIKKNLGFSYVEMVFAVAMLALLAAVATPYLEKNIQRKKELELRQNLRQIRNAIDEYKEASDLGKIKKTIGETGYPRRLQDLVIGVENITAFAGGFCITFITTLSPSILRINCFIRF